MILDRTKAPKINAIQNILLPKVEFVHLDNGIPVYFLNGGTQNIIKLDIVFKAGRSREKHLLDAKACAALLKEGTSNFTSDQLAEKIDYYGSTISSASGMDRSVISLYCLSKHLESSLELLEEIVYRPVFPENELEIFKKRSSEKLLLELSKNDVLAYRAITEKIYGKEHPYGYNSEPGSYKHINHQNVVDHFKSLYTTDNCNIYLSGKLDKNTFALVNKYLGKQKTKLGFKNTYSLPQESDYKPFNIKGSDIQNSIKIGRLLFNRDHPDYYGFFLLNTILGGYFGARLMSSIREEKAYTYNIYSYLDLTEHEGCFYISTDVSSKYQEPTLHAIREELNILQQDLIPVEELQMAKNYILGNFLNMLDGPMKSSKLIKMLIENGLPLDHTEKMITHIQEANSQDLRQLAQKYLDYEKMIKVSVGNF